ncbi:hypothetical protein L7F22_049212 [Adiantum nelumboides]|nr:hypothetical protein [Adiantum nelumboides]
MPLCAVSSSGQQELETSASFKPASGASCASTCSSLYEKAHNRVIARLLSCLVNEHLVDAYLIEAPALPSNLLATAAAATVTATATARQPNTARQWLCVSAPTPAATEAHTSSFWAPLSHLPLLALPEEKLGAGWDIHREANGRDISAHSGAKRVGLLDPDDFAFPIVAITPVGNVVPVRSARQIMEELGRWHPGILAEKASLMEQMTLEMESSALQQESAYILHAAHARQPPLELATASAIDWEQNIVEGHPTHPMHKSRFAVPPTFRSRLTEIYVSPPSTFLRDAIDWANETVVPVHELQLPNVHAKFPHARQLSLTHLAHAQVSLRTVLVEALPCFNLKLAVGMQVGSCMRTVSPWSTHIGPTFGPIAERVIEDKDVLQLCSELASVVGAHPDPDCAKHLSCIIRQDAQSLAEPRGERVVVCAALKEKLPYSAAELEEEYVVNSVLGLHTQEQRSRFFNHYARRYLQAFMPPLYKYGVGFEAHLQNVLARFRRKSDGDGAGVQNEDGCSSWELVGFAVRDLGGIKVHQPTLQEATGGLQVEVWNEEASALARDVEDVHDVAFTMMVHGHLFRMARALGVHHDGSAWEAVRRELHALLPADCPTRRLWLHKSTAPFKAFFSMKLQGLFRHYLYTQVPNLLLCRSPAH